MQKVTITEKKVAEERYPWWGINGKGLLVYFRSKKMGVVIDRGETPFYAGENRTDWIEETFNSFYGTIEVSR